MTETPVPLQHESTSWTAADLSDEAAWTIDARDYVAEEALQGAGRDEVDRAALPGGLGAAEVGMSALADEVARRLRPGPGVARVRGLPVVGGGRGRAVDLFAWLMRQFGRLLPQNTQGDLVYLVETTGAGADRQYGSRGSGDLLFHTDQAAAPPEALPRVLGMLGLQRAALGGETRLASGHTVLNALRGIDPSLAASLTTPVYFGRPADGVSDAAPVRAPMVTVGPSGRAEVRLNRYFAELGARATGVGVPARVAAALDAVDAVLDQPGTALGLLIEPGDGLLVDNATVLHNRTAYEDDDVHRRSLARLWAR